MKLLTAIAIGLAKTARATTNVSKSTYEYVKEDVVSIKDGFKTGWEEQPKEPEKKDK
mgnify:CR=1 FL=1